MIKMCKTTDMFLLVWLSATFESCHYFQSVCLCVCVRVFGFGLRLY